jgi:uncharacterized membrane protein YfcA
MEALASVPLTELVLLAVGVGVAGLIAGVIAGLLGVGGGIVLVPVLFQAFSMIGVSADLSMPLAVGTSLATIIPTSVRSTLSHHRHGAVDWAVLRAWALPTILGVLAGSAAVGFIGGDGLKLVFALGAGSLGLYMLLGPADWRVGEQVPLGWGAWPLGGANGFLSVLMGIGGGTFGVTVMTVCGAAMHRAVATAAGFGAIIAVPGTIGMVLNGWDVSGLPPLSLGYVSLPGLLLVVPATLLTTPLGVALAHRLDRLTLRRAFGVFLCLTAARMALAFAT